MNITTDIINQYIRSAFEITINTPRWVTERRLELEREYGGLFHEYLENPSIESLQFVAYDFLSVADAFEVPLVLQYFLLLGTAESRSPSMENYVDGLLDACAAEHFRLTQLTWLTYGQLRTVADSLRYISIREEDPLRRVKAQKCLSEFLSTFPTQIDAFRE